ncbi:MAG TPA: C1 family peptidase [Bacteroidales bacterium]|nr:C1 family peptidase [Bacteroidales bacterium]
MNIRNFRQAFITTLLLFFSFSVGIAQLKKHIPPVNKELTEFYQKKKSLRAAIDEKTTGYIPPYTQLSEYYIENEESSKLKSAMVSGLPSVFDLRKIYNETSQKYDNLVSPVKNQGSGNTGGNCWAFAALSSIESMWYNPLSAINALDLSEQNMATCHGYSWAFGAGGNEFFAQAYLSRLQGAVLETDVPYNTTDISTFTCKKAKPVAYFPESRRIYGNIPMIKKVIMDYGAVATNIHWDTAYYKKKTNIFYSTDRTGPNHAISIVGWNDTITTQAGKGAWIAKNSWGTTWGASGFFYIAYGDKQILKPASYYPTMWATESVDTVFKYNNIGVVSFFGYEKESNYALLKYTSASKKLLKSLSTFLPVTGSSLTIDIYSDSLSTLIHHSVNVPVQCPGTYAFDIMAEVEGTFYVKLTYFTPGVNYSIPVELKTDVNGEEYANPFVYPSGYQWVSANGNIWQALGSDVVGWEANIIAHLYAITPSKPVAVFTTDKYEVCAGSTVTYTAKTNGNINKYLWVFGEDASPAYATGAGPHVVTYSSNAKSGLRYPALYVIGGNDTVSFSKPIKVVNSLTTLIAAPTYIKQSDSAILTAIVDADSYNWYPSTNLSDTFSKSVVFKADNPGLYKFTLTAKQGNCQGQYSLNVYLKNPPSNDKPCNAITLSPGENGPFSNVGATADYNEVHPADTNCYLDKTWCNEGGVQNSVWFKVIGPDNGKLSVNTRGMDNQLALYSSESCDNIKFEDLVAANDDYYGIEDNYAAALDEITVIPGKTYWLQVDGSFGGVEGEFYITITDTEITTAINQISTSENLTLFPNPGKGVFTVHYKSDYTERLKIRIFGINGTLVYQSNEYKTPQEFSKQINLNKLSKGVYFINVQSEHSSNTVKYIAQ